VTEPGAAGAMSIDRPDGTVALRIDDVEVGCLTEAWLERALARPSPFERVADDAVRLRPALTGFAARSAALAAWAEAVRIHWGLPGWRDESVVIRDERDGRPLASIERALLRPLGLLLRSVQACVYTVTAAGPLIWVARRAEHKPVDPGRLDALVAGGIAGFDSPRDTLLRECAEEAGIAPALAGRAREAGMLELCVAAIDDGVPVVHRERVALHDLELPPEVVPRAVDGEHAHILALRPDEALASIEAGGWTRDGGQATADLVRRLGWMHGLAGDRSAARR
jgi:8-oxo-dGTP pyrophosphatase MutT (NUDIX family)